MILRPYQLDGLERVRDAMRRGKKRILIVSPTGTGKGTLATHIAALNYAKNKRSAFLVHVREIAIDIAGRAFAEGIEPALVMPDYKPDEEQGFYCGTIQSYISRTRRGWLPKDLSLVQFDEAHHFRPKKGMYHSLTELYPNAVFIGHTATPIRMDGTGLGDFWDEIITLLTYQEAIDQGWLVKPRYFTPYTPDLTGIPTKGGDYDDAYTEKLLNTSQLVGGIVEHYARFARDRQGIVYAIRRTHGRSLTSEFSAAGFNVEYIDGETDAEIRRGLLDRFKRGVTQIIVNVGVLTEGIDVPCASAIVLARPSKSVIYHLQTIGRGLRTHEGKTDCMILDHASNVDRLGMCEDYGTWALKRTTGKKPPAPRTRTLKEPPIIHTCENCGQEFYSNPCCPKCGWVLPKSTREEDFVPDDGVLTEVSRKAKAPPTIYSAADKLDWFAMLKYIGNMQSYKSGWASYQFKNKFGHFPFKVHSVAPKVPSEEVLAFVESRRKNRIRQLKAIEAKKKFFELETK
jgi:DNA repair protein RadD